MTLPKPDRIIEGTEDEHGHHCWENTLGRVNATEDGTVTVDIPYLFGTTPKNARTLARMILAAADTADKLAELETHEGAS